MRILTMHRRVSVEDGQILIFVGALIGLAFGFLFGRMW